MTSLSRICMTPHTHTHTHTQLRGACWHMTVPPCICIAACSRVLLHKLTVPQLVKKFPTFCGTHYLPLSWATSVQSMLSQRIYLRSIIILSFHLRIGLPSSRVTSTKPLMHLVLSSIHTTFLSHLILYLIIQIFVEHKLRSPSLCSFLHSPVTSSLLVPNNSLNTLFSSTLSLCFSLNVRNQVPHPYKTTGRVMDWINI